MGPCVMALPPSPVCALRRAAPPRLSRRACGRASTLRIPFEESDERGRFNQSFSGEAHRFEFAVGEQTVCPAPAAAEDR